MLVDHRFKHPPPPSLLSHQASLTGPGTYLILVSGEKCYTKALYTLTRLRLEPRLLNRKLAREPSGYLACLFFSYRRQELLDCVTHMRLLAWLLHGSLSHFVHCRNPHVNCHPVKFEENTHIADYVLIILFSFAEQLKVRIVLYWSLIREGRINFHDRFVIHVCNCHLLYSYW